VSGCPGLECQLFYLLAPWPWENDSKSDPQLPHQYNTLIHLWKSIVLQTYCVEFFYSGFWGCKTSASKGLMFWWSRVEDT
jgi:hypothetical protein